MLRRRNVRAPLEGAPRDFDELVRRYGSAIASAGSCDVLLVAHHLWYRETLEEYQPPYVVGLTEVLQYAGITYATWCKAQKRLPLRPLKGSPLQVRSTYRFADVRKLYEAKETVFSGLSEDFSEPLLPGYREFLVSETKKLIAEMDQGYVFDIPSDLPQNNEELFDQYQVKVAQLIRHRLKYGIDVEDAIGEIWVKLIKADVLKKFIRSGPKRLPESLTVDQVLDYLGIEWEQWDHMLRTYDGAPQPSKGEGRNARYRSRDVRALDETNLFPVRGLRHLPQSCVSRKILDRYFMVSAHQNLKNLFRTLDRRFNLEDTVESGAYVRDAKIRHRRPDDGKSQAWEDSLFSEEATPEQIVSLKQGWGITSDEAPQPLMDLALGTG